MLPETDKWYSWKVLVGMFFLFLSANVVSAWSISSLSTNYTNAKVKPLENDIHIILNSIRDINNIVVENNADIREIVTMLHERNKR